MKTPHFDKLKEHEQKEVLMSLDLLCKDNPDVVRHLQKLAEIKETKPILWQMGIKTLKL